MTKKAQEVADKLKKLEGSNNRSYHIGYRVMDYSGVTWTVMLVIGDIVTDTIGVHGFSLPYLVLLAIIMAVTAVGCCITAVFYLRDRTLPRTYEALCESGEIAKVHHKIIRRWVKVRKSVGINNSEARAKLEEFPDTLRKAVELQEAILSDVAQMTKHNLAMRMIQIMREALEPLATELQVSHDLGLLSSKWEADANQQLADQRQACQKAASELRAEYLLRTT